MQENKRLLPKVNEVVCNKGERLIVLCFLSQLSVIVKLIPSPDWFVGVDGLNLCEGGQWKQEVTFDLHPYDAGTDSGFTFSSPNFPTTPPENITMVIVSNDSAASENSLQYSHIDAAGLNACNGGFILTNVDLL